MDGKLCGQDEDVDIVCICSISFGGSLESPTTLESSGFWYHCSPTPTILYEVQMRIGNERLKTVRCVLECIESENASRNGELAQSVVIRAQVFI